MNKGKATGTGKYADIKQYRPTLAIPPTSFSSHDADSSVEFWHICISSQFTILTSSGVRGHGRWPAPSDDSNTRHCDSWTASVLLSLLSRYVQEQLHERRKVEVSLHDDLIFQRNSNARTVATRASFPHDTTISSCGYSLRTAIFARAFPPRADQRLRLCRRVERANFWGWSGVPRPNVARPTVYARSFGPGKANDDARRSPPDAAAFPYRSNNVPQPTYSDRRQPRVLLLRWVDRGELVRGGREQRGAVGWMGEVGGTSRWKQTRYAHLEMRLIPTLSRPGNATTLSYGVGGSSSLSAHRRRSLLSSPTNSWRLTRRSPARLRFYVERLHKLMVPAYHRRRRHTSVQATYSRKQFFFLIREPALRTTLYCMPAEQRADAKDGRWRKIDAELNWVMEDC